MRVRPPSRSSSSSTTTSSSRSKCRGPNLRRSQTWSVHSRVGEQEGILLFGRGRKPPQTSSEHNVLRAKKHTIKITLFACTVTDNENFAWHVPSIASSQSTLLRTSPTSLYFSPPSTDSSSAILGQKLTRILLRGDNKKIPAVHTVRNTSLKKH